MSSFEDDLKSFFKSQTIRFEDIANESYNSLDSDEKTILTAAVCVGFGIGIGYILGRRNKIKEMEGKKEDIIDA